MSEQNNTVDSMLPIPKLFAYGLQHVLAMYAGAVAVPIIIAQAMHLPVEDLIRLIQRTYLLAVLPHLFKH